MTAMFVHPGAGLHGRGYSAKDPGPNAAMNNTAPSAHHHIHHHHHDGNSSRHPSLLRSALRPLSTDGGSRSLAVRSFSDGSHPLAGAHAHHRPLSEVLSTSKKDLGVRFSDSPEGTPSIMSLQSDDGEQESVVSTASSSVVGSRRNSIAAATSSPMPQHRHRATRRRPRAMSRPGTRYALAHPAPLSRTKQRMLVQLRPRLLLQLQRLSSSHRPTPELDVVPSGILAGTILIPKLAKRFPRIFLARPHVGPDDVLIMRSEKYDTDDTTSTSISSIHSPVAPVRHHHHDSLGSREVVALVSPASKDGDSADIVTGDGSVWSSSVMANGSFEFSRIDEHGVKTTARWVLKKKAIKQQQSSEDGSENSACSKKWTFSVLDPSTRRHPVLGTLSPQELIIYDSYRTAPEHVDREEEDDGDDSEREITPTLPTTRVVPEEYKLLMAATGSWISLRLEGWPASANPKMRRVSCDATPSKVSFDRRTTFPLPNGGLAGSASGSLSVRGTDSASASPSWSSTSSAAQPSAASRMPARSKSTGSAFSQRRRDTLASGVLYEKGESMLAGDDPADVPSLSSDAAAPSRAITGRDSPQSEQEQQEQEKQRKEKKKKHRQSMPARTKDLDDYGVGEDGKGRFGDKMRRMTHKLFHRKSRA